MDNGSALRNINPGVASVKIILCVILLPYLLAACQGTATVTKQNSLTAVPTAVENTDKSNPPESTSTTVASNSAEPTPTIALDDWLQLGLNTSWQWQLVDPPVDQSFDVQMYDIDLFDNDADSVAALHDQGRIVICYMNAGGWEDWRPDTDQFPASIIGKNFDSWEGEKWLDIRRLDLLGPILETRLDMCRDKGFDGIEPDNVDGYLNDTGFPLTYEDQLAFNIWLAQEAHKRGLSIGLKNNMDQIDDLLPYFDWALNEECFEYEECDTLLPFIKADKPVFNVEYELNTDKFCQQANTLNFNSIKKNLDVDAYREACR